MDKKIKFKEIFKDIQNKSRKDKIFIVILIGILLMVIALPVSSPKKEPSSEEEVYDEQGTNDDYARILTVQLEKILSCVEGAGNVRVMVSFKNSGETVLAKDISRSEEKNDTSVKTDYSETHIYYESSNQEKPYVISKNSPQIEGVIVVCKGGDNQKLVSDITTAINSLLGVPVHRIKVMKMS